MIAAEHMMRAAKYWHLKFTEDTGGRYYDNKNCGSFGICQQRRNGVTIKVLKQDRAYMAFVEYALANQDNPHLPKIHRVRQDGFAAMIVMETLYPIELYDIDLDELLSSALVENWHEGDALEALGAAMVELYRYSGEDQWEWDELEDTAILDVLTESLWNAHVEVCEEGCRQGFAVDTHSGNIMQREDGTPVIIDPWCWWSGGEGIEKVIRWGRGGKK